MQSKEQLVTHQNFPIVTKSEAAEECPEAAMLVHPAATRCLHTQWLWTMKNSRHY